MKENFKNIDEVVKSAFENFEADVNPHVWTNVQNAIGNSGATPTSNPISSSISSSIGKSLFIKIAAITVTVGSLITGGYFIVADYQQNIVKQPPEKIISSETQKTQMPKREVTPEQSTKEMKVEEKNTTSKLPSSTEKNNNLASIKEENKNTEDQVVVDNNDDLPTVSSENTSKTETTNTSAMNKKEEKHEQKKEISQKVQTELPAEVIENTPTETKPVAISKEVEINPIPNVITPNGDGSNDFIKISGTNLSKIEIVIMDKAGNPVYRITSLDQSWNGKDQNGFDLIQGQYFMAGVVVDKDGNTKNIKKIINLFK